MRHDDHTAPLGNTAAYALSSRDVGDREDLPTHEGMTRGLGWDSNRGRWGVTERRLIHTARRAGRLPRKLSRRERRTARRMAAQSSRWRRPVGFSGSHWELNRVRYLERLEAMRAQREAGNEDPEVLSHREQMEKERERAARALQRAREYAEEALRSYHALKLMSNRKRKRLASRRRLKRAMREVERNWFGGWRTGRVDLTTHAMPKVYSD